MSEEKKELSLKDKVDKILKSQEELTPKKKNKKKKLKMPRKSKTRKAKAKKGYIGVIKIDENNNVSGEKAKLDDSTISLKDGTYHALKGTEILRWDGKYPVIIQHVKKRNPYNFEEGINETFGQKLIMARMLKDVVIKKSGANASAIVWVIGIAIAGYVGYSLLTGGF